MTLTLHTEQHRAKALQILQGLSLDTPMEVQIREAKKSRSMSQHRLMWVWNTVIAAELGEGKEAVHRRHKEQYLMPIYERDDAEYAAMMESLREVWRQGGQEQAVKLKDHIVSLTSTTKATVAQMTEFLEEIERGALELAITLPHPQDIYTEAMGRAA